MIMLELHRIGSLRDIISRLNFQVSEALEFSVETTFLSRSNWISQTVGLFERYTMASYRNRRVLAEPSGQSSGPSRRPRTNLGRSLRGPFAVATRQFYQRRWRNSCAFHSVMADQKPGARHLLARLQKRLQLRVPQRRSRARLQDALHRASSRAHLRRSLQCHLPRPRRQSVLDSLH